jgi:signal transduction histidine kinase
MRSSTDGPDGEPDRLWLLPAGLGVLVVLLLAATVADLAVDSRSADVALFAIAAAVGATAIALAVTSLRRSRRTQAEATARQRRDTELFDSMLRMLDHEREQVAHELHDGPQQLLAAIRLMADAVGHAVREGDQERATDTLSRLEQHAGEASEELRETTRQLHPVVLEQRGLLPALEALQEMVQDQYGAAVRLQRPAGEWHANADRDAALYGLARDAAVGAAMAGAGSLGISLRGDGGGVQLTVESDRSLSGLPGADLRMELLRARAARIGGTLEITRTPTGELVAVRAP